MLFIRSLVSKCGACIIALILSLGVIMPIYSYYTKKGLVCVAITAPFSYQPSSCSECTKLNICFSYNIKSVSNAEYTFFVYFCNL